MLPVPIGNYIALSTVLFLIGAMAVIMRRNPLIMLMGIELMLNAANIALIAFARLWGNSIGHIFAFLVITVAAAEAAIGLAIIVVTYRRIANVDIDEVAVLKG